MKGIPLRIEIGPRDIQNNVFVASKRNDGVKATYPLDQLVPQVHALLDLIYEEMYEKAMNYLLAHTTEVHTYDEFKDVLEHKGGYVKMMWCGDEECENKIKADTNATSRCMPFDQTPFDDVCPICGKKAKKVVLFAKAY